MTMTTDGSDHELDRLFRAARADAPVVSDALFARILGDAAAHQPGARMAAAAPAPAARPGLWRALAASLGGNGMLAGLGTAAVAGLMVGLFQPAALTAVSDAIFAAPIDQIELFPGVDVLFSEG